LSAIRRRREGAAVHSAAPFSFLSSLQRFASKSWNSSHASRGPDGGCSQADLKSTGGDGLMYCFAAN